MLIDEINLVWCREVSCNYFIPSGDYKTFTKCLFGEPPQDKEQNIQTENIITLFDMLITPEEHHEVETAYV